VIIVEKVSLKHTREEVEKRFARRVGLKLVKIEGMAVKFKKTNNYKVQKL